MSAARQREITTVTVHRSTHERLKKLRPFESMSFDDLISDMADVYENHG